MSKEGLLAMDYNPAFPDLRRPCGYIPKKDRTMPSTPQIALDEALPPGEGVRAGLASKLMSYLSTVLSDDELADVKAILDGQEAEAPSAAMDRAMRRHADNMRRRADHSEEFAKRFPDSNRLKY